MSEPSAESNKMSIKIVPSKCASIFLFLSMALGPSFVGGQFPSPSPVTIKPADSAADGSSNHALVEA
jgi:hypothetical protein